MNAAPKPFMPTRASVPTSLYRHFAADGSLLYVGISLSWPARTKAHAGGSHWFEQVARVELEQFPSREAALEAEREAIQRERPRFNVIHNRPVSRPEHRPRPRKSVGPLGFITGRALVGPALIYRDDEISLLIAWGEPGTMGELTEIKLGDFMPEVPAWTDNCDVVKVIRPLGAITLSEARHMRMKIIRQLGSRLAKVDAFETDLAFALAYATHFPSETSRKALDQVAAERGGSA